MNDREQWKLQEVKSLLEWRRDRAGKLFARTKSILNDANTQLDSARLALSTNPADPVLKERFNRAQTDAARFRNELRIYDERRTILGQLVTQLVTDSQAPDFDLERSWMPQHNLAVNENYELVDVQPGEVGPVPPPGWLHQGAMNKTGVSDVLSSVMSPFVGWESAAGLASQVLATSLTTVMTMTFLSRLLAGHNSGPSASGGWGRGVGPSRPQAYQPNSMPNTFYQPTAPPPPSGLYQPPGFFHGAQPVPRCHQNYHQVQRQWP